MRSEGLSLGWEPAQQQWEMLVLVGAFVAVAAELALRLARAAAGDACWEDPFADVEFLLELRRRGGGIDYICRNVAEIGPCKAGWRCPGGGRGNLAKIVSGRWEERRFLGREGRTRLQSLKGKAGGRGPRALAFRCGLGPMYRVPLTPLRRSTFDRTCHVALSSQKNAHLEQGNR